MNQLVIGFSTTMSCSFCSRRPIPLPTMQAHVGRWSEYYPSEVLGADGPSWALEISDLDVYTADVEGEGAWEHSNLTNGLDLGHRATVRVDYDCCRKVRGVLDCHPLAFQVCCQSYLFSYTW